MDDTLESGTLFGDADYDADAPPPPMSFLGNFGHELANNLVGEPPTLRRRHVEFMSAPAAPPPPVPAPVPAAAPLPTTHRVSCLRRWRNAFELWRHDMRERWFPRQRQQCDQFRVLLTRCGYALVVATVVSVLATTYYFNDPDTIIDTVAYVRHGHNGVDLRVPATEYSCADIADVVALGDVATTAASLMHDDDLVCVCAPMFGVPHRYVAVASDAGIEHLFNPVIDRAWTGALDDGTYIAVSEVGVEHEQRTLFPAAPSDMVVVARATAVRVSYRTSTCATAALVLQDNAAYCMQACDHLFDGKSVYDVAE